MRLEPDGFSSEDDTSRLLQSLFPEWDCANMFNGELTSVASTHPLHAVGFWHARQSTAFLRFDVRGRAPCALLLDALLGGGRGGRRRLTVHLYSGHCFMRVRLGPDVRAWDVAVVPVDPSAHAGIEFVWDGPALGDVWEAGARRRWTIFFPRDMPAFHSRAELVLAATPSRATPGTRSLYEKRVDQQWDCLAMAGYGPGPW